MFKASRASKNNNNKNVYNKVSNKIIPVDNSILSMLIKNNERVR